MVEIRVAGPPVPKGRPRFTQGRVYTPKRTLDYETQIGWAWLETGAPRFEGPVSVEIIVREGKRHPADLDNYIKIVLDALNGLAWADDRQVERIDANITRKPHMPGLYIAIERR